MSLPGADELFRTTGGMALSPSLAPRPAAEASRPETARTVNGSDGAEGTEAAQGAQGDRQAPQEQQSGAAGPSAGQPPLQRAAGGQGAAPGGTTVSDGRGAA
ncbi:hypothetical protein ACFVXG_44960, partial [Kitasatospora sp. NPDC058162]